MLPTLAEGLADFPQAFPELYRATVAAGEQTGHLDAILERLADYAETRQQLRQRAMHALIYPTILTVLAGILLVGGIYTVFTIKKEIQPRIETNFISIQVPFLGATPSDAEEGVVIKIEEAIQDIEGIEEIISTAGRGFGRVQVEVNADYEVAEVMDEVKNRVHAISTFPENTEKPTISRTQFQQQVVMVTVYGDVSERTLKE